MGTIDRLGGGSGRKADRRDRQERGGRPIPALFPADICSTIYDAIGIDPRKNPTMPDGRPIAILNEGEAIYELDS